MDCEMSCIQFDIPVVAIKKWTSLKESQTATINTHDDRNGNGGLYISAQKRKGNICLTLQGLQTLSGIWSFTVDSLLLTRREKIPPDGDLGNNKIKDEITAEVKMEKDNPEEMIELRRSSRMRKPSRKINEFENITEPNSDQTAEGYNLKLGENIPDDDIIDQDIENSSEAVFISSSLSKAEKKGKTSRKQFSLEARNKDCNYKESHSCDKCENTFLSRSRMLKHKLRVHKDSFASESSNDGRVVFCKFCEQVFTNGSTRQRHQKFYCTKNPNARKPVCCNLCGNFFISSDELRQHQLRSHKQGIKHICQYCGKELNSRSSIYFHNLKCHGNKAPSLFCQHCNKAFYFRHELEKHLVKHTDDRNKQCEMCGKCFKSTELVRRHKKTIHENHYKYHCDKCGHGLRRLQYLKAHKCGRVRRSVANNIVEPDGDLFAMETYKMGSAQVQDSNIQIEQEIPAGLLTSLTTDQPASDAVHHNSIVIQEQNSIFENLPVRSILTSNYPISEFSYLLSNTADGESIHHINTSGGMMSRIIPTQNNEILRTLNTIPRGLVDMNDFLQVNQDPIENTGTDRITVESTGVITDITVPSTFINATSCMPQIISLNSTGLPTHFEDTMPQYQYIVLNPDT